MQRDTHTRAADGSTSRRRSGICPVLSIPASANRKARSGPVARLRAHQHQDALAHSGALQNRSFYKVGAAVDDESSQDNEKQNCGCDGSPVIFGAPFAPPAVVTAITPLFKAWACHVRTPCLQSLVRINALSPCRVPMSSGSGR